MKYNQLSEAIIKVPPVLLDTVNTYLASVLYFKMKQYLERLELLQGRNTSPEETDEIKKRITQTMGKLQSKYGAKNISSQTASNLINSSVTLPIDSDTFFDQLGFKGITDEVKNAMRGHLKFELLISSSTGSESRGSMETNNPYNFRIVINVGQFNPRESLESANNIMSTAYHEMQHAVQYSAIKNISRNDKQLQINDDYGDHGTDATGYYTSGVEYTPQMGNVIDKVIGELERQALAGDLPDDKNAVIKQAINDVMQKSKDSRLFLGSLYRKDRPRYQKVMKQLYTKTAPVYDDFKANGIDYAHTEIPAEELEANIQVLPSIYKLFKTKSDTYSVTPYGRDMGDISKIDIHSRKENWHLYVSKSTVKKDTYNLHLVFGDAEETVSGDALQVMNVAGKLAEQPWSEADDVLDAMELIDLNLQKPTEENIQAAIEFVEQSGKYMNVDIQITGKTSFTMFGIPFEIKPTESKTKVEVISGEKIYLYLSLTQFTNLFMLFIRYAEENEQDIKDMLVNDGVYMTMINKLRKL